MYPHIYVIGKLSCVEHYGREKDLTTVDVRAGSMHTHFFLVLGLLCHTTGGFLFTMVFGFWFVVCYTATQIANQLLCSLIKNHVSEDPPRRICPRFFEGGPVSFLSWVSKTQPNHWTKRMANT